MPQKIKLKTIRIPREQSISVIRFINQYSINTIWDYEGDWIVFSGSKRTIERIEDFEAGLRVATKGSF